MERIFNWFAYAVAVAVTILWLPVLSYASPDLAGSSPITNYTVYYKNEVIVVLCILCLWLGVMIARDYDPPIDAIKFIEKRKTKVLVSISGGLCAFLWVIEEQGRLTLLHPLWVLGVSFVSPIALQLTIPIFVEKYDSVIAFFTKKKGGSE